MAKNPPANAGDIRDEGSTPGSGRSPAGGNGNPLQYSCLGNPVDGEAWWATSMGWQRVRHNWATEQAGMHDVNWYKNKFLHNWYWCWIQEASSAPASSYSVKRLTVQNYEVFFFLTNRKVTHERDSRGYGNGKAVTDSRDIRIVDFMGDGNQRMWERWGLGTDPGFLFCDSRGRKLFVWELIELTA